MTSSNHHSNNLHVRDDMKPLECVLKLSGGASGRNMKWLSSVCTSRLALSL